MTTLTDDRAPGAASAEGASRAAGPSATFTVRQADGRLVFTLDSSPAPVRVDMEDQEIDVYWEARDLGAELTFELAEGLELNGARLGWVAEDLRTGAAVSLPFRAIYDADRRVLTLALDHDRLSPVYSLTLLVQAGDEELVHDPKIHNQGPPSSDDQSG